MHIMDSVFSVIFVYTSIWISIASCLPLAIPPTLPCTEQKIPGKATRVDCMVGKGQYLDYRHIGELTSDRPANETFNVTITCAGGQIFLSWPFRASHVTGLTVQGCPVEGFLSERSTIRNVGKEMNSLNLETLHFSDSILIVSLQQLYDSVVNINNMSKDFDCGPTNVRATVFRNIQYDFPAFGDDVNDLMLMEKLLSGDALKNLVRHHSGCVYPHLERLEESGMSSLSSVHFKLVEESKYPQLSTYSVRNNSFTRIPNELKQLPVAFLPNLRHLDLSNNNIDNVDFVFSMAEAVPVTEPPVKRKVYVDLRHNQVREVLSPFVYQLAHSRAAVVDLRHNPLTCSCPLYLYKIYLEQMSAVVPELNPVGDVECFLQTGGVTVRTVLDSGLGNRLCQPVV